MDPEQPCVVGEWGGEGEGGAQAQAKLRLQITQRGCCSHSRFPQVGGALRLSHPVEADLGLSVAGGEVGLGLRRGALGASSVAHALVSTLRLLPALLIAALVGAAACAARTLAGTDGKVEGVRSMNQIEIQKFG